jgi:hypothetical protein
MENCVKAVLYTYPKLRIIQKDYEEHIQNRAILSYRYKGSVETLTEYLAQEVIRRHRLADLKNTLDKIFQNLTDEEKLLLQLRYFGKIRRAKNGEKESFSEVTKALKQEFVENLKWSERSYYRKQNRLLKKLIAEFNRVGLNKESFENEWLDYEFLRAVYRFLERKAKG